MAARILLPNGTLATLVGRTWHCADLEAIPVLDYFSSRVPTVVYRSKEETRARGVAEILVGAQYLDCDTRLWFPPDVVVQALVSWLAPFAAARPFPRLSHGC